MNAKRHNSLLIVAIIALAAVATAAPATTAAGGPKMPCPDAQFVPLVGYACEVAGGFKLLRPDGTVGFTHGVDPAPGTPSHPISIVLRGTPTPPTCAPANERHAEVVYVQPSDGADRYDLMSGALRDMVARANGHLRHEAATYGANVTYRFLCDGDGAVVVHHVQLDHPTSQATLESVGNAVAQAGHRSSTAKYWMWLDGGTGGGIAWIRGDARLSPNNANLHGPDYALTYGATSSRGVFVLMHESGHNMGAVQLIAPNTSGGWHCNDGLDVMCYHDGGSNSSYSGTRCGDYSRYDCRGDDYFNPVPPADTWLRTHWNLAHPYNQFLDIQPAGANVRHVQCAPAIATENEDVTCAFVADAWGGSVTYDIDWGDGATATLPENGGTLPEGAPQTATHAWNAKGTYAVAVTATDTARGLAGGPRVTTVSVQCTFGAYGNLLVGSFGMLGLEGRDTASHHGVPDNCAGQPFTLDALDLTSDFDLCWLDAQNDALQCHDALGNEEGVIPDGATSARITYKAGAIGRYLLTVERY